MSKATNRMGPNRARTALAAAALAAAWAPSTLAQTWTGKGLIGPIGHAMWHDSGNWSLMTMPNAASNVTIGTGFTSGSHIDVHDDRTINSLTVNTAQYFSITGNHPLTLASGQFTRLDVAGTEPVLEVQSLVLGAHGVFNINGAGPTHVLELSGSAGVTKTGSGVLQLESPYYSGPTQVSAGTLHLWEAPGNGVVTVDPGATLAIGSPGINASMLSGLSGILNLSGSGVSGSGALHSMGDSPVGFDDVVDSSIILKGDASICVQGTLHATGAISQSGGSFALTKIGPGSLLLKGPGSYTGGTFIHGGVVNLQHGSALGTGLVSVGGQAFSGILQLQNNINVSNTLLLKSNSGSPTGTLRSVSGVNTWLGPITIEAGNSIGVDGGSTLTLAGAVNANGGLKKVGSGTLLLAGNFAEVPAIDVQGGGVKVLPDNTPGGVVVVNALSLAAGTCLDLADNDLVVQSAKFTDIRAKVIAGFGNGSGITSSTSDGQQILALFDNALVGVHQWQGRAVGPNAVVGKYTYFGDANLDGQVSGDDYTVIDANLNTIAAVGLEWLSGDINLDGIVTGDDYTVIDANLGIGGVPVFASSLGAAAVPEPGAIVGVIAGISGFRRRRRR